MKIKELISKTSNGKFRKGYKQYLASLDFEEFQVLFLWYTNILNRTIRFKGTPKRFSKQWFNLKMLRVKYSFVFGMFYDSNKEFVSKIVNQITEHIDRIGVLTKSVNEKSEIIRNLNSISITEEVSVEEMIRLQILLSDSLYLSGILDKEKQELAELIKNMK